VRFLIVITNLVARIWTFSRSLIKVYSDSILNLHILNGILPSSYKAKQKHLRLNFLKFLLIIPKFAELYRLGVQSYRLILTFTLRLANNSAKIAPSL